jgi:hypothetical protein
MHSSRECRRKLADQIVNFVRYFERIAIWLPVYIQQHGRLAVCRDNRIHRRNGGLHCGDVRDADGHTCRGCLNDNSAKLLRRPDLSTYEAQHQMMFILNEPR